LKLKWDLIVEFAIRTLSQMFWSKNGMHLPLDAVWKLSFGTFFFFFKFGFGWKWGSFPQLIDYDYTMRTCNPSVEDDSSQKSDPSSIFKSLSLNEYFFRKPVFSFFFLWWLVIWDILMEEKILSPDRLWLYCAQLWCPSQSFSSVFFFNFDG